MSGFEYKVIPAPTKGQKIKGARTTADRFAHALQVIMNELGAEGWEYQRTDTLPCEEREGLMGKTTVYQNMLVFRRALVTEAPVEETAEPQEAPEPLALAAPQALIEDVSDDDTPAPAPPVHTLPGQTRDG